VKIGGVFGDTKIGSDGRKYMQDANGDWKLHPTELIRDSKLKTAFGIRDSGRLSDRLSAPPLVRRYG
jgi:hypothetical protein